MQRPYDDEVYPDESKATRQNRGAMRILNKSMADQPYQPQSTETQRQLNALIDEKFEAGRERQNQHAKRGYGKPETEGFDGSHHSSQRRERQL